jgi:hypothetical protein
MSATSVAHKSTGGTLQSLPEPVDPVGDAPDYLTFKTVAPLRQRVTANRCLVVAFGAAARILNRPRKIAKLYRYMPTQVAASADGLL